VKGFVFAVLLDLEIVIAFVTLCVEIHIQAHLFIPFVMEVAHDAFGYLLTC
jgi:hypothetical protein